MEPGDPQDDPLSTALAINDHALIGDCRTAALVARDASINWLCLPHFSSPSVFAGLLDPERGGSFVLRPPQPFTVERRYLDKAPVLETVFTTPSGRVRILDFFTVLDGVRPMRPMRELVRIVEVVAGTVELEVAVDFRPGYGQSQPHLECRKHQAWTWTWGNELAALRSDVPVEHHAGTLTGSFVAAAGSRRCFSLSYTQGDPAVFPLLGEDLQHRLDDTLAWWREWSQRCTYQGPHREAVLQSAIVLQLLSASLSGAIVAAPTTSLPEVIGGDLNWDYRHCWLRDAGLTAQALVGLGYRSEARSYLSWLLHATRLTQPELRILYDIWGRTDLTERELPHLSGYRGSRPVRIGNGAYRQRQLDVYGETVIAADTVATAGKPLDRVEARMLAGLGKTVCKQWREPDCGIWESRAEAQHHTLSKVMCWAALDRLLKMDQDGTIDVGRSWAARFGHEREQIADTIERRAFNADLGAYASVLDGRDVDASLLLMACVGYKDAGDPRMRATHRVISDRLGRNGLLYRTSNDAARSEGAFGICSFWAVDNLAKRGDVDEAERLFERLLGYASDLGLYGEEIDPESGAALGNFPQGFTHIGLINAALAIQSARRGRV
jgi:GH15 family glucan-1,4-alpha-glucosidase